MNTQDEYTYDELLDYISKLEDSIQRVNDNIDCFYKWRVDIHNVKLPKRRKLCKS